MSVLPDSPHLTDHDDGTVDEYRAISGWAVAALILGLLAPLALVDVWLSLIPLAGTGVAAVALARIAWLSPALTGRGAALVGLFLSLLCLSAAATDQWIFWRSIHNEARAFANAWFDFLAKDQPQTAHQLTLAPRYRQHLDEEHRRQPLVEEHEDFDGVGVSLDEEFAGYVAQPLIARLLALGTRAQVRYAATEASGRDAHSIAVRQLYAVTYEDAEHGPTTFFVRLAMQRLPLEHGQAAWRMMNAEEKTEEEGL